MSRSITLTEAQIEQYADEFKAELRKGRFDGADIKFQKTLPKREERASVVFHPNAWTKMTLLLNKCDKEVAWHGVAHRADVEGKNIYLISDIVVYPQTVTSATVDMDTEKYAKWLQEHDEDDRFENLRMQGHSHVNMGVTPSGTDIGHQMDILSMLGPDSFYIFMIYNKRHEHYVRIFDMAKNTVFETADVDVSIYGLDEFFKEIKENVVERSYTYQGGYYDEKYGNRPWGTNPGGMPDVQKKEPEKKPETKALPAGEKPIEKLEDLDDKGKELESVLFGKNECDEYDSYDDWYLRGSGNW